MNHEREASLHALMSRPYRFIRLEWSSELSALRVRTCVTPIQCYSLGAMAELQRVLHPLKPCARHEMQARSSLTT